MNQSPNEYNYGQSQAVNNNNESIFHVHGDVTKVDHSLKLLECAADAEMRMLFTDDDGSTFQFSDPGFADKLEDKQQRQIGGKTLSSRAGRKTSNRQDVKCYPTISVVETTVDDTSQRSQRRSLNRNSHQTRTSSLRSFARSRTRNDYGSRPSSNQNPESSLSRDPEIVETDNPFINPVEKQDGPRNNTRSNRNDSQTTFGSLQESTRRTSSPQDESNIDRTSTEIPCIQRSLRSNTSRESNSNSNSSANSHGLNSPSYHEIQRAFASERAPSQSNRDESKSPTEKPVSRRSIRSASSQGSGQSQERHDFSWVRNVKRPIQGPSEVSQDDKNNNSAGKKSLGSQNGTRNCKRTDSGKLRSSKVRNNKPSVRTENIGKSRDKKKPTAKEKPDGRRPSEESRVHPLSTENLVDPKRKKIPPASSVRCFMKELMETHALLRSQAAQKALKGRKATKNQATASLPKRNKGFLDELKNTHKEHQAKKNRAGKPRKKRCFMDELKRKHKMLLLQDKQKEMKERWGTKNYVNARRRNSTSVDGLLEAIRDKQEHRIVKPGCLSMKDYVQMRQRNSSAIQGMLSELKKRQKQIIRKETPTDSNQFCGVRTIDSRQFRESLTSRRHSMTKRASAQTVPLEEFSIKSTIDRPKASVDFEGFAQFERNEKFWEETSKMETTACDHTDSTIPTGHFPRDKKNRKNQIRESNHSETITAPISKSYGDDEDETSIGIEEMLNHPSQKQQQQHLSKKMSSSADLQVPNFIWTEENGGRVEKLDDSLKSSFSITSWHDSFVVSVPDLDCHSSKDHE